MFTYVSRFLIVYYSYSLVKFVNLIMMWIAEQAPVVAILKLKVLEPWSTNMPAHMIQTLQ